MKVQFKDVAEGSIFQYGGLNYRKIATVKVSCCKSLNAEQIDNSNNGIFLKPDNEVEVNDQQ